MANENQELALDTDTLVRARVLHRVWRALNDGDCPKCHKHTPAHTMIRSELGVIRCPSCFFTVYANEIEAIEKEFAPAMDAAVKIFEEWRESRKVPCEP